MTADPSPPADGLIQEEERVVDSDHRLISSRRIEGTRVYDREGERLGTIYSVMIDKVSGQVAYAVMKLRGFSSNLVHPLPWQVLTYDVGRNGYTVDLTSEQLAQAPTLALDGADRPRRHDYGEDIFAYYFPFP